MCKLLFWAPCLLATDGSDNIILVRRVLWVLLSCDHDCKETFLCEVMASPTLETQPHIVAIVTNVGEKKGGGRNLPREAGYELRCVQEI